MTVRATEGKFSVGLPYLRLGQGPPLQLAAVAGDGYFGAILVPVSGFWLVLAQAVMMLVVARRAATAKAGKPTRTERWAGG